MAEPVENYEKVLAASLARVIDWLKFSEVKNGVLLALSSAWTVAAANVTLRTEGIPVGYERALPLSIVIFICAILRLVWSFMPQISLPKFISKSARRYRNANLLFYGDIKQIDIANVSGEMKDRYLPASKDSYREEYLADMAQQIRVNSDIAYGKFKAFRTAGWLCFIGMAILAWPSLQAIFRYSLKLLVF